MTASKQHRARRLLALPMTRALAALVLMFLLGCVFNADGAFFVYKTHSDMFRHFSRYAILACGMTLVILTGGIDLSVGSILGLSAVTFSIFTLQWHWTPAAAILATIAVGALCGLISGFLVGKMKIQAFIATLAMMVFARGLAKALSGGQKITSVVTMPDGSFHYVPNPPVFEFLSSRVIFGQVAVVTLVFLACLLACWILLRKLIWGRHIYAVGGNEEAARYAGVSVTATKLLVYAMAGLFSAVAGICHAAEETHGDPEAGQTYELTAIAIVVIGGTNLMGGRGGIILTLLGALTIGYLEKILSLNAVGEPSRLMLTGLIIICAVLFQRIRRNRGG